MGGGGAVRRNTTTKPSTSDANHLSTKTDIELECVFICRRCSHTHKALFLMIKRSPLSLFCLLHCAPLCTVASGADPELGQRGNPCRTLTSSLNLLQTRHKFRALIIFTPGLLDPHKGCSMKEPRRVPCKTRTREKLKIW